MAPFPGVGKRARLSFSNTHTPPCICHIAPDCKTFIGLQGGTEESIVIHWTARVSAHRESWQRPRKLGILHRIAFCRRSQRQDIMTVVKPFQPSFVTWYRVLNILKP